MLTKLDVLKKKARAYRSLAAEARVLARDFVQFKDDAPVGFAITNGEVYHAHLRSAEHFEGLAQGIEMAIEILRSEVAA